jgi:hypothetical protein
MSSVGGARLLRESTHLHAVLPLITEYRFTSFPLARHHKPFSLGRCDPTYRAAVADEADRPVSDRPGSP